MHLLCIARMHCAKALVPMARAGRLPKGFPQRVEHIINCKEISPKPSNNQAVGGMDV